MTTTTTSLQVLRLDRADMLAVAMMHPVVEARIKRAAVRRRPLNARPWPCDMLSMFAPPSRSLCLPLSLAGAPRVGTLPPEEPATAQEER
jgi:hypothetical protein